MDKQDKIEGYARVKLINYVRRLEGHLLLVLAVDDKNSSLF